MNEEEQNRHHHYFKHGLITFLAALLGGFLAFYVVIDITLARMLDPMRGMKRAEKIMEKQLKDMQKFDNDIFAPVPMPLHHSIITMVQEDDDYKFIIDLKQLDNKESNVDVNIDSDTVTIKGNAEKTNNKKTSTINFSQTFSLGIPIDKSKVTKERKGDKYIVTIPLENSNND